MSTKKIGKEVTEKTAVYKCLNCGALVGEGEFTPEMKEDKLCIKCCRKPKSTLITEKKIPVRSETAPAKKAEPKKEPEKKYSKEYIRHDFTLPELSTMQKDLALKISELRAKENEKAAITKQLAADVENIESIVGMLADKINAGFESRSMNCEIIYDWKKSIKTILHPETLLPVRVLDITEEDRQQKMLFDAENK